MGVIIAMYHEGIGHPVENILLKSNSIMQGYLLKNAEYHFIGDVV